jgi:hypothetical protein
VLRYVILGAFVGAGTLAVLLGTALVTRPTGLLRLLLGASTFVLAPPYVLLGAALPTPVESHLAFYALAILANAVLYGACSAWLVTTRSRSLVVRVAPVVALFGAWVLYLRVYG